MKLLHKTVLVGCALALAVGAVSGLTNVSATASDVVGVAAQDTGWG
ncbi:hypothetical protein ABT121_13270 [Streptomyces sp. NPDC001928]